MTEPHNYYAGRGINLSKEYTIRGILNVLSEIHITVYKSAIACIGPIKLMWPASLSDTIHVFIGSELLGLITLPEGSEAIHTDIIKDFLNQVLLVETPLIDEDSDNEFPEIMGDSSDCDEW